MEEWMAWENSLSIKIKTKRLKTVQRKAKMHQILLIRLKVALLSYLSERLRYLRSVTVHSASLIYL